MIFIDKLNAAAAKNRSLVCLGLDTDRSWYLPE